MGGQACDKKQALTALVVHELALDVFFCKTSDTSSRHAIIQGVSHGAVGVRRVSTNLSVMPLGRGMIILAVRPSGLCLPLSTRTHACCSSSRSLLPDGGGDPSSARRRTLFSRRVPEQDSWSGADDPFSPLPPCILSGGEEDHHLGTQSLGRSIITRRIVY